MKKFILKLKMLFSSLATWFAKVLKENDEIVKVIAPVAVNICNFIKEYNGNNIVLSIEEWAAALGGAWGKVAVGFVQTFLTDATMDKVIIALNIADSAAQTENVADKLTLVLNYVKTLEDSEKAVAWTTISASITSALSDGKLSWQELYSIVKGIYDTKSNKA
jgi:hypothetical protein